MKIERTRNARRNILVGTGMKVYQMVVPFLMRTVMIYSLGVEYLGLNSLFASVLQVLNLAEMGIGAVMVYAMYKPIAEDDTATICALMRLYRRYYRLIGLFVGVVGAALTPLVPSLISGDVPAGMNVYILYWLNLGATVLTYWLFAYKNCLLDAHQRTDITSYVSLATTTIQYALQLMVLLWIKNYYIYVLVILFTAALNNIVTAIVADRKFPHYKPAGSLGREEERVLHGKIRDLFTGKLGSVIMHSVDTIVISAFMGLTTLAVYQNYYFILKSVLSMVEIVFVSIVAGLGNSFITETREKNYADLERFTFVFAWFIGTCTCCFLGLYQPFMEIWVGTDLMLEFGVVICFAIYFYAYTMNRLLNVYKDAAGLWHVDRFRPLTKAFINLALNLLMVRRFGLYGILLSTVIAVVVVGWPWLLHNLFHRFFGRNLLRGYVLQLMRYIAATVVVGAAVSLICNALPFGAWGNLFLAMPICVIVPQIGYLLLLHKTPQFRPGIQFVDTFTHRKLKLEKRFFRD